MMGIERMNEHSYFVGEISQNEYLFTPYKQDSCEAKTSLS